MDTCTHEEFFSDEIGAYDLLEQVTCDCKDDGERFQITNRLDVIKQFLASTDYQLLAEEDLFLLYGKKQVRSDEEVVVISSHVDCVYQHCFCRQEDDYYRGTFDNSFTNAAVLLEMKKGNLPDNVVIAFTGDEEKDSGGAVALNVFLTRLNCKIAFALVLDVTTAGWEEGKLFALENDLNIDLLTAHRIVNGVSAYQGKYEFLHFAEPDETWDYAEYGIPSLTLSAPVGGNMHGEEGVLLRKATYPIYREVLVMLACILSK